MSALPLIIPATYSLTLTNKVGKPYARSSFSKIECCEKLWERSEPLRFECSILRLLFYHHEKEYACKLHHTSYDFSPNLKTTS